MNAFLLKIYAFKFFEELGFIYPLYAVMFADYGLDAFQIGVLFTTWSVVAFVLEVPSGTLADKFSRKHILFFAQLIRIVGYGFWLFIPNFTGFLIGFICWGIESAFASGTYEALVFDELRKFGRENEYTKIIGRARSLSLIAIIIASLAASVAILLGYAFVLVISIASVACAALAVVTLPYAKQVRTIQQKKYFSLLISGIATSLKNKIVLRIIIFLSLATALAGALDEYWPLFGSEAGLPKWGLGLFIAAMAAAEAAGSALAHRFDRFSSNFFYVLLCSQGILLVTAALIFREYSVVFIIVFMFLTQIVQVNFEGKLQHAIPTETRATISSVKGLFTEFGAIAVFLSFGILAFEASYQWAFGFYGAVIIVVACTYLLIQSRKNDLQSN